MIVRMPIVRLVQDGQRTVFQVVGSTIVPPASMNGSYMGPNGYVSDISEAIDVRGPAGGSATGTQGPKGDPGIDGKDAYTIWLEQGHSGSRAAFLASLKGAQGEQGTQGLKGDKGDAGDTGLRGEQGPSGAVGPAGPTGAKGDTGSIGPTGPKGDTGATGQNGATGPAGAKGDTGASGAQGPQGLKGDTGAQGVKGDTGSPGAVLVGQVVISQTALAAINLGIREVTVDLAGTVVGERYAPYARAYKLNGGANTPGRPTAYALIDAVCNQAGKITVTLNAPLLAVGASYSITVDIVKVNAS
jgi:hypothetical protein